MISFSWMLLNSQLGASATLVLLLFLLLPGQLVVKGNVTVTYGGNGYGYWPEGTVFPCNSAAECAKYYNETEEQHISGVVLGNSQEDEDPGRPCLIEGHLDIAKNWYGYLVTATMKAKSGRFYYRFVYPEHKCCAKVLLYLEEQVASLRARMNCLQKQSIVDPTSPQMITLTPTVETSGCNSNRSDDNGVRLIECNSGRILRSDVDRTWYIGVSSCGSPTGLDLKYSIILYGYKGDCPYSVTNIASTIRSSTSVLPSILTVLLMLVSQDIIFNRILL